MRAAAAVLVILALAMCGGLILLAHTAKTELDLRRHRIAVGVREIDELCRRDHMVETFTCQAWPEDRRKYIGFPYLETLPAPPPPVMP